MRSCSLRNEYLVAEIGEQLGRRALDEVASPSSFPETNPSSNLIIKTSIAYVPPLGSSLQSTGLTNPIGPPALAISTRRQRE